LSPLFIELIAESICIITGSVEDFVVDVVAAAVVLVSPFDCIVPLERTIFDITIKAAIAPVIKIVDRIFVLLFFISWKSIYNIHYNDLQSHY
jgi:hypothetical protein